MKASKEKRLLLLIETLNRGGIETVLLRLIPQLKREGWSSTIITIRDGGEMLADYQRAGIEVIPLKQRYFLSFGTLRQIYRHMREIRPDFIVTTLFKSDVIGRLFLKPIAHRPVVPYLVTTYNHPRYWIARVFEWLTRPLTKDYIANSAAVQQFYEQRLGVRPGRIVVAPNGVDLDIFKKAEAVPVQTELHLPKNAFVVTCVANLAPNKGQTDLLDAFDRAFADNPKAFLLLVGEGEQRQALTAQRETLIARDRIFLLGRRTDVPSILKASTVFVLPTLFEGMSTALLEAMAAGKAIITTNIPENKVLLSHNKEALLVKPKDRQQLANALTQLYADLSLRNRLSTAAYHRVDKNYSIGKMATTFSTILDEISKLPHKKQRRIVHIISSLEIGGAENVLLRILPLLHKKDSEQVVITLFRPGELAKEFQKRGINVVNIGLKNMLDVRSFRKLLHHISMNHPGIVVTYLFHAHLIGRMYLQQRIPVPVIPFLRSTYNFPRYLPARLFEWVTKSFVGHYFANSKAVKDYYVKNIGVPANQITIIPNGIDLAVFSKANGGQIVRELKLPDRRFVISCVANLAKNKGHSYLLEAFEKMYHTNPNLWLLLVGEGSEEQFLKQQIESYASKKRILFLGLRRDVPHILAASDAFVFPTLFEGMANAILEAMAAGLPVITTDIPENRAIISDGVSGLLIQPGDAQSICHATEKVIADKQLREKLSHNAKAYVTDHFALQRVARQWKETMTRWMRHG